MPRAPGVYLPDNSQENSHGIWMTCGTLRVHVPAPSAYPTRGLWGVSSPTHNVYVLSPSSTRRNPLILQSLGNFRHQQGPLYHVKSFPALSPLAGELKWGF